MRGARPASTDPDEILTADQVAEMLQVKPSTILDWTRQGELPGFKLGRFWRYSRHQVEEHLARKATESLNPYR